MADTEDLLPDRLTWDDGGRQSPLDWLYHLAQSDVAVAYAELFWPRFVAFESYVLRVGFSLENLRGWEAAKKATRPQIEYAVNFLDIGDFFRREPDSLLLEQRIVHLGEVLKATYYAKLKQDFPDRNFEVIIIDDEDEYALTFCQV